MLPTTLTWMLGYLASKPLTVAEIAATSLGALQPCQKVIVVLALGLSVAPPLVPPVQALLKRARAAAAVAAVARRWNRYM